MLSVLILLATGIPAAEPSGKPGVTAKEALQPFNTLIGSWKATGHPEGSQEDRQKGVWVENIKWEWEFKGADAWILATFTEGKHFTQATIKPIADKPGTFTLAFLTPAKTELVFTGTYKDRILTADRTDPATKEEQRIVLSVLHDNRFLYRYETKPEGGFRHTKKYLVGATKEGEAFASVPMGPECIVTGGKATTKVTYKGVDYWVCCSGCKTAFNDDPEKFIKEAAEKEAAAKAKK